MRRTPTEEDWDIVDDDDIVVKGRGIDYSRCLKRANTQILPYFQFPPELQFDEALFETLTPAVKNRVALLSLLPEELLLSIVAFLDYKSIVFGLCLTARGILQKVARNYYHCPSLVKNRLFRYCIVKSDLSTNELVAASSYLLSTTGFCNPASLFFPRNGRKDIRLVAMSDDSELIALCYDQGQFELCTANGKTLFAQTFEKSILCMTFSPNAAWVAIGIDDPQPIRLINTITHEITAPAQHSYADPLCNIAFSPDNTLIGFTIKSGKIQLYDIRSNCTVFTHQQKDYSRFLFSPTQQHIAVKAWDGSHCTIDVIAIDTAEVVMQLFKTSTNVNCSSMIFDKSGRHLVACFDERKVVIWDLHNPLLQTVIQHNRGTCCCPVGFSPDQTQLLMLSCFDHYFLTVFDLASKQIIRESVRLSSDLCALKDQATSIRRPIARIAITDVVTINAAGDIVIVYEDGSINRFKYTALVSTPNLKNELVHH